MSQHLKVLKEAGLVVGRIDGQRSYYCLDVEVLRELSADLAALFAELAGTRPRLSLAPARDGADHAADLS